MIYLGSIVFFYFIGYSFVAVYVFLTVLILAFGGCKNRNQITGSRQSWVVHLNCPNNRFNLDMYISCSRISDSQPRSSDMCSLDGKWFHVLVIIMPT
jgi:hypothetical protein